MRIIISKIWQFKLPITLVAIIAFAAYLGPMLPLTVQRFLYSVSETFNDLLLFVLPFIVFSLILSSIVHLKQGAVRLILLLLPLICISNFIAIWVAYGSGLFIVKQASLSVVSGLTGAKLELLWKLAIPEIISSKYAMLMAACLGLLSSKYFPARGQNLANKLNKITAFILTKLVIPFLPVMILGVVIKMQYDDMLEKLIHNYAFVIFATTIVQATYIVGAYLIINKCKFRPFIDSLSNMIPPFITGFSTMSSAATMPLTLIATRKNVHDPDIVNFVIPGTVNFHLIGDCLGMPIISLAIMASFGYALPDVSSYLVFSLYYMVARFSVAAIPGGGMFILVALLDSHFGFTKDMLGLVQTLNLMFDSMITAMNVLANGIFAILFARIYHSFNKVETVLKFKTEV